MKVPKSHNEKAHYFLEVAENCRKKGEMFDKLIASGKVESEKLKEFKEQSRSWWIRHEEFTEHAAKELQIVPPQGPTITNIVEEAERIFNGKEV